MYKQYLDEEENEEDNLTEEAGLVQMLDNYQTAKIVQPKDLNIDDLKYKLKLFYSKYDTTKTDEDINKYISFIVENGIDKFNEKLRNKYNGIDLNSFMEIKQQIQTASYVNN